MYTPKSGLFLLLSCIAAIAAVGSVFELSSGNPDLGNTTTTAILFGGILMTGWCFWVAVQDARSNYK